MALSYLCPRCKFAVEFLGERRFAPGGEPRCECGTLLEPWEDAADDAAGSELDRHAIGMRRRA